MRGSIAEDELLSHVLRLVRTAGRCAFHIRYSQGVLQGAHGPRSSDHDDASGIPDLVIVGGGEILYRELKTERGRVDPAQRRWGTTLLENSGNYGIWRPSDEARIRAELGL